MINLEQFISKYVTERDSSLFARDIANNSDALTKAIKNKTMLVIGGAGSIGSSFIKACLQFKPKALVVVDVNENGLAELTRDLRSTKDMYVPEDYVPYPINYASTVFEKCSVLVVVLILLQIFLLINMFVAKKIFIQ